MAIKNNGMESALERIKKVYEIFLVHYCSGYRYKMI